MLLELHRAQRVDLMIPITMDDAVTATPQAAQTSMPANEFFQACRTVGKPHGDHVLEDIELLLQHQRVGDRRE